MTVREFDALAAHFAAWESLASKVPQKISTLLPGWCDAFFRHRLQPSERWLCVFAYLGDKLVGVLPIVISTSSILGFQVSRLRTPYDEHTPCSDIVLAPENAGAILEALLSEATRRIPDHLGLEIKAVRSNSPLLHNVPSSSRTHLMFFGKKSLYSFLDVQGEFDSYLSQLGQIRSNTKRFSRKLAARGAVTFEVMRENEPSEDFLQEFLSLEASGWKGRNGTAILCNPKLVEFYTTLVRNVSDGGQLEWHAMRLDGRLIAAELCIVCGGALTQPKQAFDEDFADCRPGHLLRLETIREAFSRSDLMEFNPMSDAEAHRLWHMPRDEYIDVRFVRRAALPVLCHLPSVAMQSACQRHVRSHIPPWVGDMYRKFLRSRRHKNLQMQKAACRSHLVAGGDPPDPR